MRLALLIVIAGCHHGSVPAAPTTGAIAGLVRDQDTGTAIARAQLAIQRDGTLTPALVTSGDDGLYDLDHLAPGRYDVTATYAGVTLEIRGVTVTAGHVVACDVDLALGRPEAQHVDFGDAHEGDVRHYTPANADPKAGALEGTVTDSATRERVPGAIVTATSPALTQAMQVITDDRGRFTIAALPPGTYSVSAYYTVAKHGTISVEHNLIPVRGGETAVVPLFVETEQ
ncbi:MAG TPA: carboxypeptidase-like regulatory domain-containing protein [Kofleriaceae bacterium]|nr:carboxypeptidase-like regulatory domain-containing protein [Kofleriaceae bacterium]